MTIERMYIVYERCDEWRTYDVVASSAAEARQKVLDGEAVGYGEAGESRITEVRWLRGATSHGIERAKRAGADYFTSKRT